MGSMHKSHFVSAVVGGLIVGGGLLALGITGRQRVETVVNQAPVLPQTADSPSSGLTPHDIYQRDAPGVVFVRAKLLEPVTSPFNLFNARESETSTGSGFLVDRTGDILTNYHIIQGAARSGGVTVQFEDNTLRAATVAAVDPKDDLAVLRVDMRHVPQTTRPLTLGDSTSVRVGDPTLTIGNPFGVDRTLTSGIVAALQHEIQADDGSTIDNVIQTDQTIAAGNSGAPLLDANGRVVGINSQIATAQGGPNGVPETLSFAVPIDTADTVLARVNHQPLRVAYLGLSAAAAVKGSNARRGAVVGAVDKDGPAATYGLLSGDVIQRVADVPVDSINDVLAVVSTYSPGQTVSLQVRRRNRQRILSVVLGSRTIPPTEQ
jgi:S1-C subfamily serine protease